MHCNEVVVQPALAQSYSQIWFLGIWPGGMGALLYASQYQYHVEGLVLLVPFLGVQETIAEIAIAGGFACQFAPRAPTTVFEEGVPNWLRDRLIGLLVGPWIHPGDDRTGRFEQRLRRLAGRLPVDHVEVDDGGHDWVTWLALWHRVLEASPFEISSVGDV